MSVAIFDPDSDVVTGPAVPDAPAEPQLDVEDIQGAVLPGFGTRYQHLRGVRFSSAAEGREWLRRRVGEVSTLEQVNAGRNARRRALRNGEPRPRTPVWTAIAFSADGLRLLGADPGEIGDVAFAQGMAARTGLLGDPRDPADAGHPSHWIVGGSEQSTPHALVILGAEREAELDDLLGTAQPGVETIFEQRAGVLEGAKEHFGFRDGVSQVGIRGRLSAQPRHFLTRRWIDPQDRRALAWARPGQPLVWPGQFVFGYPGQSREDPVQAGPSRDGAADWVRNGSLLTLRRLRQDVPRFRDFTSRESARLRAISGFEHWTDETLQAALVGRWPDGSALTRTEGAPDPAATDDMLSANYFSFAAAEQPIEVCADPHVAAEGLEMAPEVVAELRTIGGTPADPSGMRCPQAAHIRKVNPRDLATDQGGPDVTLTTQVLRRGIPWGARYQAGEAPEAADRGLLFMGWQTSIEDQFELLNSKWMNRKRAPEGTAGHDLLVGQAAVRRCELFGSDGRTEAVEATGETWIVPTGGGYFFGPSLSALRTLAGS